MSGGNRSGGGKPGSDIDEAARREPPAKARNAERYERQARALRENLRRRRQQRHGARDADAEPSQD